MYKIDTSGCVTRKRDGLVSHILLQHGDVPGTKLSITWVELEKSAAQKPHKHPPEQCYVIIKGRGSMTVGGETVTVKEGDMIQIPPETVHAVKNTGETTLIYVSASTPAYSFTGLYDGGELSP